MAAPPTDEGPTSGDLVDLNTAPAGTLDSLGIGLIGRRVVENRPYAGPQDLLTKRVLTRKDFEQIRSKVTVQ
jgi:DNA uptake protein ComE-like DNA-binding protein